MMIRDEKERKLRDFIKDWSSKDSINGNEGHYIDELMELYKGEYRHDYSIFFPILDNIDQKEDSMSIQTLMENVICLRQYIDNRYCDETTGSYAKEVRQIVKLLDHLNLEASRLDTANRNRSQIKILTDLLNKSREDLNIVKADLEKASMKASGLQTEFISILSVFAAVILLFVVDTQAITGAMNSMQSTSIFRLVFVLSMCGLLLFNGLFLLFRFISYIINKNSGNQDSKFKFDGFMIAVNIIFVLLIIGDVVAWYLCVENRFPFDKLYYPTI